MDNKFKSNLDLRKLLIVLMLFAFIVLTVIDLIINGKREINIDTISSEFARAMTYAEVEEGEEAVEGTDNVKFNAFFLRDLNGDGYAESIRGTCKEIGKEDTLYMELNVQTAGCLKDAKITMNSDNFYLQTSLPKDQELKDNYIGNNVKIIEFNTLNNGTQKLITGIVRSGDYSYSSKVSEAIGNNVNNYSKVNSVTLTGTYVGEDGTETQIEKQVEFNIDWYGKAKAIINTYNPTGNIENAVNEEERTVTLNFSVNTEETEEKLILKTNHIEGEMPEINGYAPLEVVYTGSNGEFTYDENTRVFTIDRVAVVGEDGRVINGISRSNSYGIKAVYPIEAYQSLGTEGMSIKVPVKTYYEGFNNSSIEFTNPYKTNIASSTILVNYQKYVAQTHSSSFEVQVGKYIYEPTRRYVVSKQKPLRIYNGESETEKDDTYTVMWKGYIGTNAKLDGITMKENKTTELVTSDTFIKTDSTTESMKELVSNVGIYFGNADTFLGEEGWIKVYDEETGNLLVTFTKDNWDNYKSENPYKYSLPVKHIRVETSQIMKNESYFYVYNVKEIDDEKITNKYDLEQFEGLQYIKSTLSGYIANEEVSTVTHTANYEAPISVANISISKNTISTQGTEKNGLIKIQTQTVESYNQVKWQNGSFLVKLPEEIVDVNLNGVTINNSNVTLESYEIIEENEQYFIKIVTKNNTPQSYIITIDADLSPDPRIATTTKQIELYASNENGSTYFYKGQDIYDVNNNLNITEIVNRTTTGLSMVSPNSLLTNQTASKYDDKNSLTVSPQIADIKQVYAIVDQEESKQTAEIGVQIKNNYASTISDIKVLGKIPFEGNTYVISSSDLGSTFTTKMQDTGIIVPEELQEHAKVYYSENENPDRDLAKEENGWKTKENVENWDNIKSFIIDLGSYVMPTGKEFVFNYTVEIPNGLEFNQVAYSHHGVYFSLDTENGKYRTQTEPNKLGFRIAEKYDLELEKYQTGKDKLISGATYSFKEIIINEDGTEKEGVSKTGVTNAEGRLRITKLYAEKIYEIREIKVPDDYEINGDVIRFIGHVNKETGELTIEKLSGNPKEEIAVEKEDEENYRMRIKVEDEAKAILKITKIEQGTETFIPKVRYRITGGTFPERGKVVTTNLQGQITVKGILINEEYTLEEVKADGYYLASQIKFKVVNNDGSYEIEILEGNVVNQEITEEDCIPTINIKLEDEKIPTYDLEITKIKKVTKVETTENNTNENEENITGTEGEKANTEKTTYLAGAKFKLYKGTQEIGEYVTDESGKVTISGLYQYVTEKGINQTYTLKEVLAPEG